MRPFSNHRRLGILALVSSTTIGLMASTMVDGNVDQLRGAAGRVADSLLGSFRAGDTVHLAIGRTQGSWLLEVALMERAVASGIVLRPTVDDRTGPSLRAYVTRVGIRYEPVESADSVLRRASFDIESITIRTDGERTDEPMAKAFHMQLIDTIAIADSSLVAGPEPFLAPPFPVGPSNGFWELVVEPAVVLGTAIVMTILLFSVRSN